MWEAYNEWVVAACNGWMADLSHPISHPIHPTSYPISSHPSMIQGKRDEKLEVDISGKDHFPGPWKEREG